MTAKYIVSRSHTHPEQLANGTTVEPGQEVSAEVVDAEQDKRLLDEGILIETKPEKSTASSKPDNTNDDEEENDE